MSVPASPPAADDLNALPPGTRFGELELLRLLGSGGFGLVYLARDHALDRLVAVKEYMPSSLAQRNGGSQVSVRSATVQETFELGLRSFVNEARLLARFDHRSLLKVHRFWEANGTAYLCMPYLQGMNLRDWREAQGRPPDAQWLLRLLLPLLDALGQLHAAEVVHRDIAPDNIYLPGGGEGGEPILLDFGAARRAIADRTQTFTAILKPSYAPLEQYDGASTLKQGPWTDLYALAAVVHYLITGRTPPAATRRALGDDYLPLSAQALPGYPTALLAAVDWALALKPADRPQSVGEFREALLGQRDAPPQPLPPGDNPQRPEPTVPGVMQFEPTQLLARTEGPAPSVTVPDLALDAPPAEPVAEPVAEPPAAPEPVAETVAAMATAATEPAPVPSPQPLKAAAAARPPWLVPGLLAAAALLFAFWSLLGSRPEPELKLPAEAAVAAPEAQPASQALAPAQPAPATASAPPAGRTAAAMNTPNASTARDPAASLPARAASEVRNPRLATASAPSGRRAEAGLLPPTGASAPGGGQGAADPQAACEGRRFLALMVCVDRKCAQPAYAQHPECQRLREIREQRELNRGG